MPEIPALFDPQLGHHPLQAQILQSLRSGRLPHAYLFHGPEGCGKEAFALGMAELLNAADAQGRIDRNSAASQKIRHFQHPDVQFIFPTPARTNLEEAELLEVLREKAANPFRRAGFPQKNTFIGIDTIRELKKEARFKLYEGRKKVFVIAEAEAMRIEAANALLKLLEEPPANLMLILVTANIHQLLPTIRSRCQMLQFGPLPEGEILEILKRYAGERRDDELRLLIRLAGFNLKRCFDFLERDVLPLRDQAIDLLRKIVLIQRSQELLSILEPLAGQKDREEARLLLWFLLLWFQDILHLKKLPEPDDSIHHIDKRETLDKFINFVPKADIPGIVWEIEGAMRELRDVRNFNPLLILSNLAIKLNRKLKNTG